jgi:hypothetical protein
MDRTAHQPYFKNTKSVDVVRCDKIEEAESDKVRDRDCEMNELSRECQSRGRKDSVRRHFRLDKIFRLTSLSKHLAPFHSSP